MKRVFYITVASALMLLSSCEKEREASPSDYITFKLSGTETMTTKAGIETSTLSSATINIYGTEGVTALSGANGAALQKMDGADDRWFPGKNETWYQWRSGESYNFYAVACYPATAISGGSSITNNGKSPFVLKQPNDYNESDMVDYMLSYKYGVDDGAKKPIVYIELEHAVAAVDFYMIKNSAMPGARLLEMRLEGIYKQGRFNCTSHVTYGADRENTWEVTPQGAVGNYTRDGGTGIDMADETAAKHSSGANMKLLAVPQGIVRGVSRLFVRYQVNEKSGVSDNWVEHNKTFELNDAGLPSEWHWGKRYIYTITVDSGIHIDAIVRDWIDVDYIEGVVLPAIPSRPSV